MDLLNESDLTRKEANATVDFASEDNPDFYPRLLCHYFGQILHFAKKLPPSVNGKTSTAHITGSTKLVPLSNWDEIMGGYENWGVPEETDSHRLTRRMRTQCMYGWSKHEHEPYEQIQRMMAAPLERKMKEYSISRSEDEEFQKGASQLYVILIKLHPTHTTATGDSIEPMTDKEKKENENAPKVWRLLVCHADTNLDSFHDQIIAPAMGWRRHYHGYKFVVPTSGATFGPQNSDAIDMMHFGGFAWDSEKYDLRHVLRKPGQKIHYSYDLGDCWRHEITLVGRFDRGTTIGVDYFQKYKFVYDALQSTGTRAGTGTNDTEWTLRINKNKLIAGAINCPPEDSNGCDGMGNYGTILARGGMFEPNELGLNWTEHGICNAFDFDLEDHQNRFDEAISQRKNPSDGCMQYVRRFGNGGNCDGFDGNFRSHLEGKHRKFSGRGAQSEVLGKKNTSKKCANCLKQKHSNADLKLFSCGRCKAVRYCGRQCQREHWKRVHKLKCSS